MNVTKQELEKALYLLAEAYTYRLWNTTCKQTKDELVQATIKTYILRARTSLGELAEAS